MYCNPSLHLFHAVRPGFGQMNIIIVLEDKLHWKMNSNGRQSWRKNNLHHSANRIGIKAELKDKLHWKMTKIERKLRLEDNWFCEATCIGIQAEMKDVLNWKTTFIKSWSSKSVGSFIRICYALSFISWWEMIFSIICSLFLFSKKQFVEDSA